MQKIRKAILKHLWWLIALSAFALLLCHTLQLATVAVDTTSLALLALILLSPFAAAIKRVKIGEFEAEIDSEEVRRVTNEVASKVPELQAEDAVTTEGEHPALSAIRELAKSDSVIALAKLRIELETTLRRLHSRAKGGQTSSRTATLHNIISDLAAREVLPRDLTPSLRDVLALCNRAIHGEAIRDKDAESVIEAGADLLVALDRSLREYGVAHATEKVTVTRAEVESYYASQYRVVTIIPLVESPQRVTYLLTHDELEDYFEGYSEFAEFVVSTERVGPEEAKIV